MGGMCGIVNLNGEPASPEILRKMTDAKPIAATMTKTFLIRKIHKSW